MVSGCQTVTLSKVKNPSVGQMHFKEYVCKTLSVARRGTIESSICFCCCCCFLGPHPRHMEVPGLGVESKLQLQAHTTATAMLDPSLICDRHHSSWQHRILNPLSEARDRTCVLLDISWVHYHGATMGTPYVCVCVYMYFIQRCG